MRPTPRDIRKHTFQTLFQLDVRGETDADLVRVSLDALEGLENRDRRRIFDQAMAAYQARREADKAMEVLAPGWPAHRQPAVDRAILRLAHYELKLGKVHPKIIVNEAIELAKEFSTDKSPAFVNGLLDKVLHQVLPAWEAAHGKEISPEAVPDAAD
ncbi:MAG: transcription antitermination factor NusB [Phycisphaerales bacterium]|jgi:N utilization substance protein B